MELLAQIEHELDWGVSCDTCLACAKLRVVAALIEFFSDGATDARRAVEIAKGVSRPEPEDHQTLCARCIASRNARE